MYGGGDGVVVINRRASKYSFHLVGCIYANISRTKMIYTSHVAAWSMLTEPQPWVARRALDPHLHAKDVCEVGREMEKECRCRVAKATRKIQEHVALIGGIVVLPLPSQRVPWPNTASAYRVNKSLHGSSKV